MQILKLAPIVAGIAWQGAGKRDVAMSKYRAYTVVMALLASLIISSPAQARLGSSHRMSGGYSSGMGYSSSYSGSSRLGGGGAVGMQRNDVAQRLRYGSSATPMAPVNSAPSSYRPGWGSVAGAAAAGGVLGYLLGGHGGYGGYGMMGGGGGMGSIVLLLVILFALAWWLMRRQTPTVSARATWAQQQQGYTGMAGSGALGGGWSEDPQKIFRELQDINTRGDEVSLRAACTPALAQDLLPNMGGAAVQILELQAEVVDQSEGVVSVRYRGTVMEAGSHPESLDELWNFVRNPGPGRTWLLAGIQPL